MPAKCPSIRSLQPDGIIPWAWNPEVLHVAPRKVHIRGGWTRYDSGDNPIMTNMVTYMATLVPTVAGDCNPALAPIPISSGGSRRIAPLKLM